MLVVGLIFLIVFVGTVFFFVGYRSNKKRGTVLQSPLNEIYPETEQFEDSDLSIASSDDDSPRSYPTFYTNYNQRRTAQATSDTQKSQYAAQESHSDYITTKDSLTSQQSNVFTTRAANAPSYKQENAKTMIKDRNGSEASSTRDDQDEEDEVLMV